MSSSSDSSSRIASAASVASSDRKPRRDTPLLSEAKGVYDDSLNGDDDRYGDDCKHRLSYTPKSTSSESSVDDQQREDLLEIQEAMAASPPPPVCKGCNDFPLFLFDEIPERLKDNPFILSGYRAHYTTKMCLQSVFRIHNETANIWTHLLGFILFVGLCTYLFADIVADNARSMMVIVAFVFGLLVCLGCSTCFHTMNAHDDSKICKILHKMDYFGITCLITGSFIPTIIFGFACDPLWKWIYLGIVLVMGAFGLIGPWFNFWTEVKYRTFRVFVYVVLVGSGVFPIIHINFILPVSQTAPYTIGLALEIAVYLCGMLIYSFCLPERLFPGYFDVWFSSHQVWHIFVLAGAMIHFFTVASMYRNWHLMPSEC
jgi:adiponectin receptor